MRICTWNVDGLNGRVEQVVQWLHDNQPDIVGLQEAGTHDPKSVVSAFQSEGYRCKLHMGSDDKRPKQGVAILSRQPLEVTQECLPGQEHRDSRLLTASTAGLSFTTVCVPIKGQQPIERKLGAEERGEALTGRAGYFGVRRRRRLGGGAVMALGMR